MAVIVPIKNLKDTNKFSSFCAKQKEPVYVTKNGYGDMVVMNMDYFEKVVEKYVIREKILEGIDDMKKGRVMDGEKAMQKLKKKYDF